MFVKSRSGADLLISAVRQVRMSWKDNPAEARLVMADGESELVDADEWCNAVARASRAVVPAHPGTMAIHELGEGDYVTEPIIAWSIGMDEEASLYPICHSGMLPDDQAILHPSGHVTKQGVTFANEEEFHKQSQDQSTAA